MSLLSLKNRRQSHGFTLIELLIVITIIASLAALITFAAGKALNAAKLGRIKAEVDGLDMAMKSFKAKWGSYPPTDMTFDPSVTNPTQAGYNLPLKQFIAKAFPRYQMQNANNFNKLRDDLANAGVITTYDSSFTYVDPARALVFWLSPFNADPANPFLIEPFVDENGNGVWDPASPTRPSGEVYTDVNGNGVYDGATLTESLFNFDKARLIIQPKDLQRVTLTAPLDTTYKVYVPSGGNGMPYLYFDAGSYGSLSSGSVSYYQANQHGLASPYAVDVNNNGSLDTGVANGDTFANPDSFQIISAGPDGLYGAINTGTSPTAAVKLYPIGIGYDAPPNSADEDNITNFSDKKCLGDARP